MNNNIEEKYIQIAIDNGFKVNNYQFKSCNVVMNKVTLIDKFWHSTESNFFDLITSKEFISTIAKIMWDNSQTLKRKQDYKNEYSVYKKIYNKQFKDIQQLEDSVTYLQAIDKRDGKLRNRISIFLDICEK